MGIRTSVVLGAAAAVLSVASVPAAAAVQATSTVTYIADISTDPGVSVSFSGIDLLSTTAFTTGSGLASGGAFTTVADIDGAAYGDILGSGATLSSESDALALANIASSSSEFTTILSLSGSGTAEIEIGYELFVDGFDGNAAGFALAAVEAFSDFSFTVESAEVRIDDVVGAGSGDFVTGALILGIEVDDFGFGAYEEGLTVITESTAVVPVPAAAWLLGSALLGLAGLRRRAA